MALPYVKINFANGVLGAVEPLADSVVGFITPAAAVTDKFALNTAYQIYDLNGLADLGITSENNANLHKLITEFYSQAGEGAECWIYGVAVSTALDGILDVTAETPLAKNFVDAANGRLRALVAYSGSENVDEMSTYVTKAQALGEWAANTLYAPLVVFIGVNEVPALDLTTLTANRVGVLVGSQTSEGIPALGILAGRFAQCSVEESIGKVRLGALANTKAYIDDAEATNTTAATLDELGYITFRTFVGKSGFFFTTDSLATGTNDDYRSLARRRTIDKAYRIAYATLLEHINEEVPVTENGTIVAYYAKSLNMEVVSDIYNSMTANGELSTTSDADKGCECEVDITNNIVATSKLFVAIKVRPYGYAKYIEVNLGFQINNN